MATPSIARNAQTTAPHEPQTFTYLPDKKRMRFPSEEARWQEVDAVYDDIFQVSSMLSCMATHAHTFFLGLGEDVAAEPAMDIFLSLGVAKNLLANLRDRLDGAIHNLKEMEA